MRGGTNAQKKVNVSTTTSGTGNVITSVSSSNESISVTKDITAVTTVSETGSGNVVTGVSQNGDTVTVTKGMTITISTSAPSGGSNGDIWIQY